nr:hypothetical protein [Tanacetum cinerariifolium]
MSSASSAVTNTSVYTNSEPWRFQWVSDNEPEAPEEALPSPDYVRRAKHLPSPEFQWVSDNEPEAPEEAPPSPDYVRRAKHLPSPEYVPRPEHPPSPEYVPRPEHPPSPDYVPGLHVMINDFIFSL